jgi:deoxyribodipyrimidine photolyase-related protein
VEGFIRQIIGWREFMFGVYVVAGEKHRNSNFFKHTNKLPKGFYDATTEIPPIDDVINHLNKYAYAHHIERLMILGNYLLLRKTKPTEVYRWFMELFIDSYDWVMVPNVFGMSQYADGGLMTTKPYISSSNYILQMSNYKKGDWCTHWDSLFWNFIGDHYDQLAKIPRMRFMITAFKKRSQKI